MDYGQTTGICPWCGAALEKSKSNFNKGKFKRCATCYNKHHLRTWYESNRERELRKAKRYYQRTRERRLAVAREYHASHKMEHRAASRKTKLARKYGLTVEQYNAMLAAQNGQCFLCGEVEKRGRRLAIDHCHKTQRILKLLCRQCNMFVGVIERDPDWLKRALQYLKT